MLLEHALDTCAVHLKACNARNSEIEAYLTRYLLVLAVAVFEEEFERLISDRAMQAGDPPVASFVTSATHQLLRHTKISDLKGFLGRFGPACQDAFDRGISSGKARVAFDAIVQSRHEVAHRGGSSTQMTFDDLRHHIADSRDILHAFAAALPPPPIKP